MLGRLSEAANDKRLILCFDAGCSTCTDLAQRVERVAGDKLEVRSLRDPQVGNWRKEALCKEAPWEPTLMEIKDGHVTARTGLGMGISLSLALGPILTWRVLQLLGEADLERDNSSASSGTTPSGLFTGMNRRRFLKGAGGAVVAISIITGVGWRVSPATAAKSPASKSLKIKEFRGGRLAKAVRKAAERQDVINIAPDDLVGLSQSDGTNAIAGIHELDNGNRMLAVSVALPDDRVLFYYETRETPVRRGPSSNSGERPVKRGRVNKIIESEAKVLVVEGESGLLENSSHNGRTDYPTLTEEGGFGTQAVVSPGGGGCGGCGAPGDLYDYYLGRECANINTVCAGGQCGSCVWACWSGPLKCLICVGFWCPFWVSVCCTRYKYACRACGAGM